MRLHVVAAVLLAACGQPLDAPGSPGPADAAAHALPPAASRVAAAEVRDELLSAPDASTPAVTDAAPEGPVVVPVPARFVREGAPTPQARRVAAALDGAADMGLDAADYGAGTWDDRLRALDGDRPPTDEAERLEADLRAATRRFVLDLRTGRARPQALEYALPPEPFDAEAFVDGLAAAADPAALLDGLGPRLPAYDQLVHALPRLRMLAERRRGEPPLPSPTRPLQTGQRYPAAPRLAELLATLGDLEEREREAASAELLSPELAGALRRFQARHALPEDGVLDRRTVEALNVPLERRVAQVGLALERWRWMPREAGPRWVVVNVPAQRLQAVEGEPPRETLAMHVIVGATAEDRRTPVLAARIDAVMFSPYWDVPERLARGELARLLARRPDLAEGDGFFVDVDGTRLPIGRRTLALVKRGGAHLRQRPGLRNSLGPLKVVMPNPHDVYLHGTAKPRLFNRNDRALSHGCIRVADPAALAAFLLADRPGFDRARIENAMTRAEPLLVPLESPATTLLTYATATADEDGTLRFWPDLYGADAQLERDLAAERSRARVPRPEPRPRGRDTGRRQAREADARSAGAGFRTDHAGAQAR